MFIFLILIIIYYFLHILYITININNIFIDYILTYFYTEYIY